MEETTIRLSREMKSELDKFRQYKNESYNELIRKLLFIAKNCKDNPDIGAQTVREVELARERIRKGDYYTGEEAKKILGI